MTGIYHVMLRGINKQDIFLSRSDFELLLGTMRYVTTEKELCTIFAYCILHNHAHLLLRVQDKELGEVIQVLETRFVMIYNMKYERVGHLFQGRYRSEPVDDFDYFRTLLRYIHRNAVKAGEAKRPEDYVYSSWREYLHAGGAIQLDRPVNICDVQPVLKRIGFSDLVEWVNTDADDKCMDIDDVRVPISDETAWEMLARISHQPDVEAFKRLPPKEQVRHVRALLDNGVSLRQASRLSSLTYSTLRYRIVNQGVNQGVRPCLLKTGSDPLINKTP